MRWRMLPIVPALHLFSLAHYLLILVIFKKKDVFYVFYVMSGVYLGEEFIIALL